MHQLHPKAVWYFFLTRNVWILILVGMFIPPSLAYSSIAGILGMFFIIFLILFSPILLITFIWARLFYTSYKYELRDDAFRKEQGVIWKKYVSVPYNRIQNVDIYRGLLARLLGLSDLHIQTAGQSGIRATEGRLPGLDPKIAEQLRDELIKRAKNNGNQTGV